MRPASARTEEAASQAASRRDGNSQRSSASRPVEASTVGLTATRFRRRPWWPHTGSSCIHISVTECSERHPNLLLDVTNRYVDTCAIQNVPAHGGIGSLLAAVRSVSRACSMARAEEQINELLIMSGRHLTISAIGRQS